MSPRTVWTRGPPADETFLGFEGREHGLTRVQCPHFHTVIGDPECDATLVPAPSSSIVSADAPRAPP